MRSIALVVAAFLGLLAAGSPLSAESASSPEGDTERRASSFIPVDEITVRAEALHDRIVELEQLVSDDGLERSAEEEIAGVELEIEAVQTRLDETASRRHGPTELETLSASWRGLDARLLSAKDGIDARASQLAARLAEIRDADVRWRRARADARAAQAPGRVVDLAAGVLSGLRALEEKLEESRNAALDIQARIAEERRLVGVGLKEVEGMRVELAASLLVRQDDPVWRARPSREGVEAELEETRLDLARIGAQLGEHVSRHRERFLLQALLVFVLAWGLSRARSVLRRHAESSKEAGESILPLNALARPWAAALLLGTLAMPFLHPERVLGHQIAVLLLTIPVWLLVLRTLLPTASRVSLMGLAALPLVDVVRLLAGGFELLVQVLLVAE
ncbi:MAG: hypothetical protein O7B29_05040, partial [Deltaproteobacteria bacterium]|nr:hypothetical protein [Deltaproteobacteria bacterium]